MTKPLRAAPAAPPALKRGRGRPRKGDEPATPPPEPGAPDLFEGYVGEAELARQRGISTLSLRSERARGGGPPFTKDGRRILYSVEGFRAWLKAREVETVIRAGK